MASNETVLWDTEVKGFGIRARIGGGKSYILHYRVGTGRSATLRKLTIGKHGSPWTPDTARAEAKRLLGKVAAGHDPAMARQEDRRALKFGELIDIYLAEGITYKKPSTLKADRGRIEHHLRPLLGNLRIDAIGRTEIERMRNAVAAGKTAEIVGTGKAAGRQHSARRKRCCRTMRDAGQRDLCVCERPRIMH